MLKTLRRHFSQSSRKFAKIGIIGVPFGEGQRKKGVELGPSKIRESGLVEHLKEIDDIDIKDYGDITIELNETLENVENMLQFPHVSACNRELSKRVTTVLGDDRICITLGGDHSIGLGTVDGHYNHNENVIVLWVDAHADLNTNKSSHTGSVHGMPMALLAKELSDCWPYLPTMDWRVPRFSLRNLAYIGLRSVDKFEKLVIDRYGIPTFAMEDIQRYGIDTAIRMSLQCLDPTNSKPIHVSFDIDSLDVLEAPSTGTPVRGGLTLREAIYLMEQVYNTGRLKAIDMVEVNPLIGTEKDVKHTIDAAIDVIKAGIGFNRRGMPTKGINDITLQTFKS